MENLLPAFQQDWLNTTLTYLNQQTAGLFLPILTVTAFVLIYYETGDIAVPSLLALLLASINALFIPVYGQGFFYFLLSFGIAGLLFKMFFSD